MNSPEKNIINEGQPVPPQAERLVSNLERRGRLLARISQKEVGDIPEIVIKDTFLKFLDKKYKGLGREYEELDGENDDLLKKKITDLNKRIFTLLNRSASIADKKQDTSPVTTMYAYPYAEARPIDENSYSEFKNEVKGIIELCKKHGASLKSITGMQAGLGLPKLKELDELLRWSAEKKVDFKSITGMQNGLGVPSPERYNEILTILNKNQVKRS